MGEENIIEEKGKSLEDIKKEAEQKVCQVQKSLYLINEFLNGPMCGRCFPCSLGTYEAKIRLIKISQNLEGADASDVEALRRIGTFMSTASFCKKGKDTGKFLVDILSGSSEEFDLHLQGICSAQEYAGLVEYIINPDLCTSCGKCFDVCKFRAVANEKQGAYLSGYPHYEIIQKKCTRCGECFPVCPAGAIERITFRVEELVNK
jgi:ferredoxin